MHVPRELERWEALWRATAADIALAESTAHASAPSPGQDDSPYPGLASFGSRQSEFFFVSSSLRVTSPFGVWSFGLDSDFGDSEFGISLPFRRTTMQRLAFPPSLATLVRILTGKKQRHATT